MGLAGHQVGKGSPFLDLDQLRPGDPIVVETVDSRLVYRVLGDVATGDLEADLSGIPGREIVRPTDVQVLSPTPARGRRAHRPVPDALTTCHPRFSARQRLIIHARLDGGVIEKTAEPKDARGADRTLNPERTDTYVRSGAICRAHREPGDRLRGFSCWGSAHCCCSSSSPGGAAPAVQRRDRRGVGLSADLV